MEPIVILGAGLAGLSASYHLGHENCVLLEAKQSAFGHIRSTMHDGYTWDEGPHVSFTKHPYVRDLFAEGVDGAFEEFEAVIGNYYNGAWIEHPAQVNLFQVPEPLRSQCLESFLRSRTIVHELPPANYQEWIDRAFGPIFAHNFAAPYTRKYWTRDPKNLSTDWLGERVLSPEISDVVAGAKGPSGRKMNYITRVRYPRSGGYQGFARKLHTGAQIQLGTEVVRVNLAARRLTLAGGSTVCYRRLVSTIPLPEFIQRCENVPTRVVDAAQALSCSELLLINFTVSRPACRPETWFYVYDEDKLSTRVNFTEHLSRANAPAGWSGIQVETYSSRHRPRTQSEADTIARVRDELVEMRLLEGELAGVPNPYSVSVPWANVIFDNDTAPALDIVWRWLEEFGLEREDDDLHPLTLWDRKQSAPVNGALSFAGRYGQWKYFWTDDCVLRGRKIAEPPLC